MSLVDLKLRLHDVPGIETLTMQILGGRQVYSFAGRIVALDASASDTDVQNAIRTAVSTDAIALYPGAQVPLLDAAAAGVATAPAVIPATSSNAKVSTMTATPGSHALTIKDALENHAKKLDQILQASMATLQATLDDQVTTVQGGTAAVISKVKTSTDDFKAILGQFSNEI